MKKSLFFIFVLLSCKAAADTVCASGCDHTTIQACVDTVTAGEFCEVQADTPGGSKTYSEFIDFDVNSGTDGSEISLYGRDGDTITVTAPTSTATNSILEFDGVDYWKVGNFCAIGSDGWADVTPLPDTSQNDQYNSIRVRNGSDHIEFYDIGTPDKTDTCAVWGGHFYAGGILIGANSGAADGVSMVKLRNVHAQTTGHNNATGSAADADWGDLIRIEAPQVIVEDVTMHQAGHNPLTIGERRAVVRRVICDNDWTDRSTGRDGYRACAIVPGDTGAEAKDSTGDALVEYSIFRNALLGPSAAGATKFQAHRGVYRFNNIQKSRGRLGLLVDLNNGDDGDVTESKFYHTTILDTGTFWRTNETSTGLSSIHEEVSFVNGVIQDLGLGDNLAADVYIYNDDESDSTGYSDGWKDREYRGITLDKSFADFDVRFDDDNGTATTVDLTTAISTWSNVFQNWDNATVTFADENAALTSWDWSTAYYGLTCTGDASLADVEPLTLMDGAGTAATSGTLDDGRFFVLADTDWGLGYFGEENDYMWIEDQRVQILTLNKDTGAVTFTPAATWSDNAEVFPDFMGSKPNSRCAAQDIEAPEPPTSTANVQVDDFTLPTGAGTVDITFSGAGDPVGAMVFVSGATADDTNAADAVFGCGFWSSSESAAVGLIVDDNLATSDGRRFHRQGQVIYLMDPTGTTETHVATMAGITNGVRITTTTSATALKGMAVVVFGTGARAFSAGSGTTANSSFSVTHGLGAAPDGVAYCYNGLDGGTAGTDNEHGSMSIGFSDNTGQRALGVRFQEGQADGVAHMQLFTDRVAAHINNSGETFHEIEQTDRNSTSLEFTARGAQLSGDLIGLAWNHNAGYETKLSTLSSPDATGTWSVDEGIQADAALVLLSQQAAVDTADTDSATSGVLGLFGTDFTREYSAGVMDENAADPTNANSRLASELWLGGDDGTEAYAGNGCAANTSGYSCSFDTADATTHQWIGLTFGSEAAVAGEKVFIGVNN